MSRLRHRLEYAAGRWALWAVNALPERFAYAACGALGRLYFRCSRRRQRIALRVLGNAFPRGSEAERLKLARVSTGNVFKVVLDTVRVIPLLENGRLLERVDASEFLARAPSPPFLGLTAHLGSWEIAAIVSALLFGEAHGVARVFANPLLQAFILRNRRRAGLHIHPRRGGVRGLARALRRGCVGLQVVDQNQRLRGVFAPFFGELASTERAAATLAVRHGYPIVVGSALRVGPGLRFRMRISEPFWPAVTGDREKDVERAVCEVNRRLEEHILAAPEQYLWIHDRYRTRPPGETHERQHDPSA